MAPPSPPNIITLSTCVQLLPPREFRTRPNFPALTFSPRPSNDGMKPATNMSASPAELSEPELFIIQNFIIEAYPTIADVPYASVSEQRGKTPKTSENERFDELYGRCRTCMGHKSGEQLLLCDDCDRGFHMTCLVPALRDVPKGEWHCPKCTRDRLYNIHARAAAVVNLRKVLNDIEMRASLPPKLQLKLLDITGPNVTCSRGSPTNHSSSQQLENSTPTPRRYPPRLLPPKFREKRAASLEVEELPPPEKEPETSVLYKRITRDSVQKRTRSLRRLAIDLAPLVDRLQDKSLANSLSSMQQRLSRTREHADHAIAATRTSHNALSRSQKKQLANGKAACTTTCQYCGRGECEDGFCSAIPPLSIQGAAESKLHRKQSCTEDQDHRPLAMKSMPQNLRN